MKKFLTDPTDPEQQPAKLLLDWLYSDEEAILIQFSNKSYTYIFTRLPLNSQIDFVLYSNVSPFRRGEKRVKQDLFGYWLKNKKVCIHGYVGKDFDARLFNDKDWDLWCLIISDAKCKELVEATDIIEDMNKLARNRLCHMYIKKHPLTDCAIDEKLQKTIQRMLDCYWLHNNIPKDIFDYVENFGKTKELTLIESIIDDRLLLRYTNGEKFALSERLIPYLEEEKSLYLSIIKENVQKIKENLSEEYISEEDLIDGYTRRKDWTEENIQKIKKDFEFAYALFKELSTFTPSRRAIYTKRVVDAVQTFAKSHNVRKFEVEFLQGEDVYTQSLSYSILSDYDNLYYYDIKIHRFCFKSVSSLGSTIINLEPANTDEEIERGIGVSSPGSTIIKVEPENILSIKHGRTKIYVK